jgi:peptidoglycan hydrolase-like protein with peptidoglycan-binding domain
MSRMPGRRGVAAMPAALVAGALLVGCGSVGSWTPAGVGNRSAAASPTAARTMNPGPTPPVTPTATPPGPSVTPTGTASPEPTKTPSSNATPTGATPSATPTAKPRTTLVRGDSGPKVRQLQERLTELGYWLGTPDGSYGPLTQQAVYALQKAAGVRRDGVVGPRTQRALAAGIRPESTLTGDGVEILLGRQLLLVVRGGEVRTILNTSTGNGEAYTSTSGNPAIATTPKGSFTVYRAVDGMVTNSLGQLWRPRFFHRGFAVHGSPSVPPWPASHGCARLSNSAIDMVWARDLMPIGSRLVVR